MTGVDTRLLSAVQRVAYRTPDLIRAQVASLTPVTVVGPAGDVPVVTLGTYFPAVGEWVWILRIAGSSVVIGSATTTEPPGSRGMVTAYTSGSGSATVTVGGRSFSLQHVASYTPVVGHMVGISWTRTGDGWSGLIIGQQATPSTPTAPGESSIADDNTPQPAASGTLTIPATQVGTWQLGRWRGDTAHVIQSGYGGTNRNEGYWFYGGGFSAIPAGATIEAAAILLKAWTGGASAATPIRLHLHGARTRPPGRPAVGPAITGPAPALRDREAGEWTSSQLVAAAQSIADGTWSGLACISTAAADYTRLCGISESSKGAGDRYPLSGALKIRWRR